MILEGFILLFIVIVVLRKLYLNYLERDYRYNLFEIRDELRSLEASMHIDNEDKWVIDYLDHTISKSIKKSYTLSLFHVIMSHLKFGSESNYLNFKYKLEASIEKYEELSKIKEKVTETTVEYLVDQHFVSFLMMNPVFRVLGVLNQITSKFFVWVNNIFIYPDTSDSTLYVKVGS